MKKPALLPASLAGFLALVALLYAVVTAVALRPEAYPNDPPFNAMAGELVPYLKGRLPSLSPTLFTQRERLHMEDVLALFAGGRVLGRASFAVGLALMALALRLGGRKRLGSGLLIGFAAFGAIAACLGAWAALDFDGWFVTMHQMVFANDLWLLDPAESMLINMLPIEFFMAIVLRIGAWFAAGLCALVAGACALRAPWERRAAR